MTFLLPHPLPSGADELLRHVCFAGGYDQTPVPTDSVIENGRLIVTRGLNESGYLLIPWRVDPYGTIVTSTTTLRERLEPYRLMVEVARGKLNQVRTQLAEWQDNGLQSPPMLEQEVAEITREFARAALVHSDYDGGGYCADTLALQVLARSCSVGDRLARAHVGQVLATRLAVEGKLSTRLAARYTAALSGGHAQQYLKAFNATQVAISWRNIEPGEGQYRWDGLDAAISCAAQSGLPVSAGPVIDLSPATLPEWINAWVGDLATLAAFMCDFLEAVIVRYRAVIRRWVVCGGLNHAEGLGLGDDDRLRLAARLFEAAAQADPELDLVVSIAQPWGDYLVNDDQTISPLAFADDLVRAGLRVSAVELELRPGLVPRGSMPRDLLDTIRLFELFAKLRLPLEVLLSYPASADADVGSDGSGTLWPAFASDGTTSAAQASWGSSLAALALSRHDVRAVTWDHWHDIDPHLTPHGGLLGTSEQVRPLLEQLELLRNRYLR